MRNAAAQTADAANEVEPLLRVRDVAAWWQCSPRQVLRAVARGDIQALSLPGMRSLRFRRTDVQPIERPRPAACQRNSRAPGASETDTEVSNSTTRMGRVAELGEKGR